MLIGILAALLAGLMWGLVFIVPLLLPEYSGIQISLGRYTAFGFIALAVACFDTKNLSALTRNDWRVATKLSVIGNLLYYAALASAIQLADAPMPTVLIGTLPVWIAIYARLCGDQTSRHIAWHKIVLPLAIILAGILLVNLSEIRQFNGTLKNYLSGGLLACCAVAAWTWYPVQNGLHLQQNPHIRSASWSTAQGIVTLPFALFGFLLFTVWQTVLAGELVSPLGVRPLEFGLIMLATGLLGSWMGMLFWNIASQRLPCALSGQLIVFETLAALLYAFLFRSQTPTVQIYWGVALLCAGVLLAIRIFQDQPESDAQAGIQ